MKSFLWLALCKWPRTGRVHISLKTHWHLLVHMRQGSAAVQATKGFSWYSSFAVLLCFHGECRVCDSRSICPGADFRMELQHLEINEVEWLILLGGAHWEDEWVGMRSSDGVLFISCVVVFMCDALYSSASWMGSLCDSYWHIYDVCCDGCKCTNCSLPQLSRKSRSV